MSAKKKSQVENEDGGKTGEESSDGKKKGGLLNILKRRVRFVIKLDLSKLRGSKKAQKVSSDSGPDAESKPAGDKEKKEEPEEEKAGKGKKAAKEKKPKEKKAKKEKAPKEKKGGKEKESPEKKDGNEADTGEEEKKKFPVKLVAIISGGAVAAGVIAFIVVNSLIGNQPSAHQLLAEANVLVSEQKYTEAAKTYEKAAKKDKTLVEAYLGQANALVDADDIPGAIKALETGLKRTGDNEQIQARLNELDTEAETDAATGDSAADSGGAEESEASSAAPAPSVEPITFKDKAFEKMLRQAMGVTDSQPVSEADLAGITTLKILGETHSVINGDLAAFNKVGGYEVDGVLYSDRGSIKTLDDLTHFSALRKLTIGYNHITDTNCIKELTSLETLGLYFNDITDLSGLSGLQNLKYLYIYNNNISDISPLAGNTGLLQIWLDNNAVADISPLKNLTLLTEIYIDNNKVQDISPIAGLKNLRFFVANNNQISDISVMKDLASLSTVSLTGNPVSDFSPVSHVDKVQR